MPIEGQSNFRFIKIPLSKEDHLQRERNYNELVRLRRVLDPVLKKLKKLWDIDHDIADNYKRQHFQQIDRFMELCSICKDERRISQAKDLDNRRN